MHRLPLAGTLQLYSISQVNDLINSKEKSVLTGKASDFFVFQTQSLRAFHLLIALDYLSASQKAIDDIPHLYLKRQALKRTSLFNRRRSRLFPF